MYSSIKTCVKTDESSITEMFSCNKGIRQGDGLSPVSFSLFMNVLPKYFRDDHFPGVMLGSHSLNCLMYQGRSQTSEQDEASFERRRRGQLEGSRGSGPPDNLVVQ